MESQIKKQKIGKLCSVENCTKFALKLGKCIAHGGGKRCCVEGCIKSTQGKTDKCKNHGGGKRCLIEGCNKTISGVFNVCKNHGGGKKCTVDGCITFAQGKTDKCRAHGGGKRCSFDGCTKSAESKDKCKKHGGGKRCVIENCTKPVYGKTDKCVIHEDKKKCSIQECDNLVHGKTNKCIVHKDDKCSVKKCNNPKQSLYHMCIVHDKRKKCCILECTKYAVGKSNKCKGHGGGRRCPNCINWIDSRSARKKYDYYCVTCFRHLFPDDPRSLRKHEPKKEIRVRNFINSKLDGFVHDISLYTGNCNCTHRRRIDHRKLINNTILAIETDEFGHKKYDQHDEEIRYDDLYMIHSGKWIFIRFNPDGRKIKFENKLEILYECILKQIKRIESDENTELVEIIKLFY